MVLIYREPLRNMGIFKKGTIKANRYIELCNLFSWIGNPFLWISKSFPRLTQIVLFECNMFSRFTQFVPSFYTIRSLGLQLQSEIAIAI